MTSTLGFFTGGLDMAGRVAPLLAVNAALALFNLSKVQWVLGFNGFRIGVMLSLPSPIPTIWDLANIPSSTSQLVSTSAATYGLSFSLTACSWPS